MAKKKSNFSIRRLIYNDKYLIIVSLLLAVLVWVVTSLNIGTDETKTIKVNVPISLGDEVSKQLGMQYYTLLDSVDISVTISGAKYVIGQVDENDLSVKFDTSNVNKTGEQTVPILVTNKSKSLDFSVSSFYPSSIGAYFDVNATKIFDLYLKYDENNVADGYVFGNAVLSEDKVLVSGPKTYLDRIERAVVDVDFGTNTELTELYNADCPITFEGEGVEASYLKIYSRTDTDTPITAVSVTLPVLKIKSLPVSVNLDDKPENLDDNALRISYSKDKLKAGVLDSADISSAVIGTVRFNQLKVGVNTFDFDVTNLEGITVLDDDEKVSATIIVSSIFDEKTVNIRRSDVKVEGVPKGYTATVRRLDDSSVTVIAPKSKSASSFNLDIKCDVSETNDNNIYPLTITVSNDKGSWVYGSYNATVELTKE